MTRRLFLVGLCVAALFALAGCGDSDTTSGATPATGATGSAKSAVKVEELGEGDQSSKVAVDVDGPVQVNYRRITIPPGEGTGEHCHYGNLIAVVEAGTLTHYAPIYKSGVHTYNKGDSILEGKGYIHQGKNEGGEDVVLLVTYVTPEGEPLAETDLEHCDPNGPTGQ